MGRRVYMGEPLLVPGCVGWEARMLSFSILHAAQHEKLRTTQPPREMPAVFLAGDREASLVEAAQGHSKATVC